MVLEKLVGLEKQNADRLEAISKQVNVLVKLQAKEQATTRNKERRAAAIARRAASDKKKAPAAAVKEEKKKEKSFFTKMMDLFKGILAAKGVVIAAGVMIGGAITAALSHEPTRKAIFEVLEKAARKMGDIIGQLVASAWRRLTGGGYGPRPGTQAIIDNPNSTKEEVASVKELNKLLAEKLYREKEYYKWTFTAKKMREAGNKQDEERAKSEAAEQKEKVEGLMEEIEAMKEVDKLKDVIKEDDLRMRTFQELDQGDWMLGEKYGYYNTGRLNPQGLQTGGPLSVPGSGSGDKVPAILPPGSFVMNRNAAGYQMGGVPVMLEPGEDVYGPGQWGPMEMLMNRMVPRFQEGGQVHEYLQKMNDKNIQKVSARPGMCVTGSLNTMEASGVPNPAATGQDRGNNPRGAIVQLMQMGWGSVGDGRNTTLQSPYGTSSVNVMSASQYKNRINQGGVPSGSLIFQTRHDDWNATSPGSRGYDMAIAQKNGGALWNGQSLGSLVYGNTQGVIQLAPGGVAPKVEPGKVEGGGKVSPNTPAYGPGDPGANPLGGGKAEEPNDFGKSKWLEGLGLSVGKAVGLPGLGQYMDALYSVIADEFGGLTKYILGGFGGAGAASASEGPGGGGGGNNQSGSQDQDNKSYGNQMPDPASAGALSHSQVIKAAIAAGFTEQQARVASAIATGESGRDPTNSTRRSGLEAATGEDSVGLMQINWGYHKNSGWLQNLGITKREQLFDPATNMKAAKYLYDGRGGWGDWTVYTSGKYRGYIDAANGAKLQQGGVASMAGSRPNHMRRFAQAQDAMEEMFASKGSPIIINMGGGGTPDQGGTVTRVTSDGAPAVPNLPGGPQVVALLELQNRLALGAMI